MTVTADENLARWVVDSVTALRRANLKASQASEKWNRLNEAWNEMADANGWTDIVDRNNRKSANLPLKNAMDTWSFWEREAKRIAASIEAEATAKKLLAYAHGKIGVGEL